MKMHPANSRSKALLTCGFSAASLAVVFAEPLKRRRGHHLLPAVQLGNWHFVRCFEVFRFSVPSAIRAVSTPRSSCLGSTIPRLRDQVRRH